MPHSILIGCRVDGGHGPLMEHDSTQNNVGIFDPRLEEEMVAAVNAAQTTISQRLDALDVLEVRLLEFRDYATQDVHQAGFH